MFDRVIAAFVAKAAQLLEQAYQREPLASALGFVVASILSRSARQGPSFGSGWTSRAYSKQIAPERSTLRTVLRETFSSRTSCLIDLPLTKCS